METGWVTATPSTKTRQFEFVHAEWGCLDQHSKILIFLLKIVSHAEIQVSLSSCHFCGENLFASQSISSFKLNYFPVGACVVRRQPNIFTSNFSSPQFCLVSRRGIWESCFPLPASKPLSAGRFPLSKPQFPCKVEIMTHIYFANCFDLYC